MPPHHRWNFQLARASDAARASFALLQFLEPCGYSAVVAGNASAIFALFGILGNVIVAPIMQKSKQYRIIQQAVTICSAFGVTLLLVANKPGQVTMVYGAWGLLGLLQGPLGPLTFEHGAEVTYPTSPVRDHTERNGSEGVAQRDVPLDVSVFSF